MGRGFPAQALVWLTTVGCAQKAYVRHFLMWGSVLFRCSPLSAGQLSGLSIVSFGLETTSAAFWLLTSFFRATEIAEILQGLRGPRKGAAPQVSSFPTHYILWSSGILQALALPVEVSYLELFGKEASIFFAYVNIPFRLPGTCTEFCSSSTEFASSISLASSWLGY